MPNDPANEKMAFGEKQAEAGATKRANERLVSETNEEVVSGSLVLAFLLESEIAGVSACYWF